MTRTRHALFATLALLLGCAAAFALLEAGVRVWEQIEVSRARAAADREGPELWALHDERLGYRLRPGVGDVNAQGYLGEPVGPKGDATRMLILGDSLGFYGDGPGDTYVGRMAEALRGSAERRVEVVNASVPGYTNYQELLLLREYAPRLCPDLVGVAFVLNDLHRFLHRFTVEDGELAGTRYDFAGEAEESVRSPWIRLARRSHALLWLKNRFDIVGRIAELFAFGGYTFEYRPDFAPAWQEERWPEVEEQIAAMQALGSEHGFRLFLIAFPYAQQLRPDYLERDRDYVLLPQRRLRGITARLGIPMLDLFDALERTHFRDDDVHLTAAGRRAAARRIARFLQESGLLRPAPESECPVDPAAR